MNNPIYRKDIQYTVGALAPSSKSELRSLFANKCAAIMGNAAMILDDPQVPEHAKTFAKSAHSAAQKLFSEVCELFSLPTDEAAQAAIREAKLRVEEKQEERS